MPKNKYGGVCNVINPDKRVYGLWYGMLRRCYDKEQQERSRGASYAECTVCDRWLNYSNFAKDITLLFGYEDWLNKKGYCLDKDTINPDNKVYSRANCCFIPYTENIRDIHKRKPQNIERLHELRKVKYMLIKMMRYCFSTPKKKLVNIWALLNAQYPLAIAEAESARDIEFQRWTEERKKQMRDRLIELILECSTYTPNYAKQARLHAEYVATHLLNAGVIIPLCKVGDTVYQTDGIRIYELEVFDVSLKNYKPYYETEDIDFDDTAIGKRIFLTREGAEKALAERSENGT